MIDLASSQSPRIYFAFRSPYSRLGLHLLQRAGVDGVLIPFTRVAGGAPFSNPTANPAKRDYVAQDAFRMTARAGLPMALPDPFDPDYEPANRAFTAAQEAGVGLAFAVAVSDVRWGEGRNISDISVLAACAEACGLDRELPARAAADEDKAREVRAAEHAAADRDGVFGVPFLVSGAHKYWGHDRFELYLERLGLAGDAKPAS